jgi:hypothetical protein
MVVLIAGCRLAVGLIRASSTEFLLIVAISLAGQLLALSGPRAAPLLDSFSTMTGG